MIFCYNCKVYIYIYDRSKGLITSNGNKNRFKSKILLSYENGA